MSDTPGRPPPRLVVVAVLVIALAVVTAFVVTRPGPTASGSPEPNPGGAPVGDAPPELTWTRHDATGLAQSTDTVVRFRDGFLAISPRLGAVDGHDSILSSTDGLHWTTIADRPFGGDVPRDLDVAGETVIGSAYRQRADEGDTTPTSVWRSGDGASWDLWMDVDPARAAPLAFANVADRWVAVPASDPIRTSEDGLTWTDTPSGEGSLKNAIIIGPAGLVVPGSRPVMQGGQEVVRDSMWLSVDGLSWTESVLGDGRSANAGAVAADDRVYVALGSVQEQGRPNELAGWWSADGRAWQRASIDGESDATFSIISVVAYDGGFFAVTVDTPEDEGQVTFEAFMGWWSPDGKTWSRVGDGPVDWLRGPVVVDGDRLLLYSSRGEGDGPAVVWEATPAS